MQRDLAGEPRLGLESETTLRAAAAGGAAHPRGGPAGRRARPDDRPPPDLGAPVEGSVRDVGDFRVVARPLFAELARPQRQLQPATELARRAPWRSSSTPSRGASLQGTLGRLHLFLGARGARRHRPGLPGRLRRGSPRDAPHRRAHPGRSARWRARATRPSPCRKPQAKDEVAEAGRHAGGHAPRARRRPGGDRGRAGAPARVRGRRLPRAAHARSPASWPTSSCSRRSSTAGGGPRDREAAAEIAGSALRSSHRMRRLVGDLLLLARADAGRRDGPTARRPRPVDLAAVVRDAGAEARAAGARATT